MHSPSVSVCTHFCIHVLIFSCLRQTASMSLILLSPADCIHVLSFSCPPLPACAHARGFSCPTRLPPGYTGAATGGTNRRTASPGRPSSRRTGKNILYAVMALLPEMDDDDLVLVKRDIDARLAGNM